MSKWLDFYKNRLNDGYLNYVKNRYAPFILEVNRFIKVDSISLELGAGIGTISLLIENCVKVVSDNDADILTVLHKRFNKVMKLDCRKPSNIPATIVHSHGVLEHMNDSDICKVINNNKHTYQVHYVPGLYDKPSFGDERLLPLDYWYKLVKPDCYSTFNEGLDYMLTFYPR